MQHWDSSPAANKVKGKKFQMRRKRRKELHCQLKKGFYVKQTKEIL